MIEYKYMCEVFDNKDELSSLIKDFGEDDWEIQHTGRAGYQSGVMGDDFWIFEGILKRETVRIKF